MKTWGYLRENSEKAKKAGIDLDTGLKRTGLDEYLKVIFPKTNDWIYDKEIEKTGSKRRPDYRSESLKLIIEFDGLPHYMSPLSIINDQKSTMFYKELGYKVVRIPYFIQLSNKAVKELFGVEVKEPLFDEKIPSLNVKSKCSPAFLCLAGIERMAKEFQRFPEQFETNLKHLKEIGNDFLTGASLLEYFYNR